MTGTGADPIRAAVLALLEQAAEVGHVPVYGSADWRTLPPTDVRRVAATWRAAECWRDHRSLERVAEDVAEMVEADRRVMESRLAEASHDGSRAADWSKLAGRATHAELEARRRWVA